MKKVAVLIPCYNEEKTIEKVVTDFKSELKNAEIYVYDNNSTDNSVVLAKKAGAIVRFEPRQGKGNVIRSMFRDIEADAYLMVDADDTYSVKDAKKMLDLILNENGPSYDMVVGDRLSTSYYKENKRKFHNFGNKLVQKLIQKLFRVKINDIMTGYRAFSRDFVKGFPIISKGFEIETEMTIHAVDKNFKIIEIPIEYRDRPAGSESKLSTYKDGAKVLMTIGTLFKEYRPAIFFNFLAALFSIAGIILMLPAFTEYFETNFVTKVPSLIFGGFLLIIGILNMITGIILEVVVKKHRQDYEIYLNEIHKNAEKH
ncbi:glycosyltransferase [Candidatus Saccharibacteria bacterium]|nr:glycosyltransferase [Candidatus Saccharibacteria bacterium]